MLGLNFSILQTLPFQNQHDFPQSFDYFHMSSVKRLWTWTLAVLLINLIISLERMFFLINAGSPRQGRYVAGNEIHTGGIKEGYLVQGHEF